MGKIIITDDKTKYEWGKNTSIITTILLQKQQRETGISKYKVSGNKHYSHWVDYVNYAGNRLCFFFFVIFCMRFISKKAVCGKMFSSPLHKPYFYMENGIYGCIDTWIHTQTCNTQTVIHILCTDNRRAMSNYEPLTRPTQSSSINDRFDFARNDVWLSMLLRILFRLFDVRRWDFRFKEIRLRPIFTDIWHRILVQVESNQSKSKLVFMNWTRRNETNIFYVQMIKCENIS